VPNKAGDSTTLLLETGNKPWVAWGIHIYVLHLHIGRRMDNKQLTIVTHEPRGKGHDLLKGDVVEVFNEFFKIGQVNVKNVLATRRAFGSGRNCSSPGGGDMNKAHPAVCDCFILKKVNNHLAVCDGHVKENMIITWLDHFMPEHFLVLGVDLEEISVGARDGCPRGGHCAKEHGGGLSS
jgi:hypothetical protein